MTSQRELTDHYASEDPVDRIRTQLISAGVDIDNVTVEDLAGVDEFHLGGKLATTALLESFTLPPGAHHLDIGCGIGGAARAIAARAQCIVTGIDLTPAFVDTAATLSAMVGMSEVTTFVLADASTIQFPDAHFDAASMIHVGMNIDDKAGLFAEVARVLAPTGSFHVYDIMRVANGDISYPMPWSASASTSFLAEPATYVAALEQAGFDVAEPIDRTALVADALTAAAANPPAVNLSHLMGASWPEMFANLRSALQAGIVAPIEVVARKS